jgi:hypothetical protein
MTPGKKATPDTEIREMAVDEIDLVAGGATWFEDLAFSLTCFRARENVLDGFTRRTR